MDLSRCENELRFGKTQGEKYFRQIVGQRRKDFDAFSTNRMRKRDAARVQRKAMKPVRRAVVTVDDARAVPHVTDERMINVPQVAANLMQSPGFWHRENERTTIDR